MTNPGNNIASEIIQDFGRISGNRANWESHWQEIAERVWPTMSGQFYGNGLSPTPGEKRTELLFDSTAAIALGRFASVVDSLITPMNETWHRLRASDPALQRIRRVRAWFEEVNRILRDKRYAPKGNFISQNHTNMRMLGAFGTGCMFVDELRGEPGLRYKSVHLGEIYFAENHQNLIDRAWRRFPLTARQAKQKWGDRVPDKIKNDANEHNIYWFIHCVKPREDADPGRADYRGMPFASYYVSETDRVLLEEGGYNTFPYAITRYYQGPGEVYGRAPAMDVLPAIKTLNEEKKTVLKQGHRTVDPVLLIHDDGIIDGFSLKPGALNGGGVTADGRPLVHTLPVGNIAIGKDLMDDERLVINDAFLVSLFQILIETPQMTATEVLERVKEKGMLLNPTVGRQQAEYLGPMIERELDLLSRQGLLPPIPQELLEAAGEYTIEYDSPLSRAARSGEAAGFMRSVEVALNVANVTQDPSMLDHFDFDTALPEIAEIQGAPLRWMRAVEAVQAIREGRQAQAEEQKMVQALPGVAAMTKATAAANKSGANAA